MRDDSKYVVFGSLTDVVDTLYIIHACDSSTIASVMALYLLFIVVYCKETHELINRIAIMCRVCICSLEPQVDLTNNKQSKQICHLQ